MGYRSGLPTLLVTLVSAPLAAQQQEANSGLYLYELMGITNPLEKQEQDFRYLPRDPSILMLLICVFLQVLLYSSLNGRLPSLELCAGYNLVHLDITP